MSGFGKSRVVEGKALAVLAPYIQERSDGRFVLVEKSPLAASLQQSIGDVLYNRRKDGRLVSVEIKAEERHTGNLFLETWSNLNATDGDSWESRGSNPGWLLKIHPTLLFYYFLDVDRLYIIKGHALFHWAFAEPSKGNCAGATRIHDFPCKPQSKYVQFNDTHGHLVPVDVVRREVGFHLAHPKQLAIWPEWSGDAA